MTEDQIKHMVNRFLFWRLPENFAPDCGIKFDAEAARKINPQNHRYEPVGANLFDATQADDMVRHMVAGLPGTPVTRGVDLDEQKRLLLTASSEIQQLRRANEVLAAKVETMELFGLVFRTRPDYGGVGMTEDIVWRMQRQIDEIDGIQVMRAS